MQKTITIGVVALAFFSLSILSYGCATLFKGSTDKVDFSSTPTQAEVFVNGQLMGKTPLQLKLQSKHSYNIEFRMEGYQTKTVVLNNSVGGGWVVLDILGGLIPIVIDAATGDWFSLDEDHVQAVLENQQAAKKSDIEQKSGNPSEYKNLGAGHSVKKVMDEGAMVTLDDGSLWDISPDGIATVSKWTVSTKISVGNGSGTHPYLLIDLSKNVAVAAKYIGQK
jgi:hypothetical protein